MFIVVVLTKEDGDMLLGCIYRVCLLYGYININEQLAGLSKVTEN